MRMPGDGGVTVNQRILVHLLDFTRAAERFDAPVGVTQQGIADALGVRRSHVTIALQALGQRGLVDFRVARVANSPRRKKAYSLTPLGYMRAHEARAWIASLEHRQGAQIPVASPMG